MADKQEEAIMVVFSFLLLEETQKRKMMIKKSHGLYALQLDNFCIRHVFCLVLLPLLSVR